MRREYASKIIQAITLSDQPSLLLRKYVRTAKPALVHPPDLIRYTLALAESSLVEAWQFQRTFAETDEVRPHLFKRILDWVIYRKSAFPRVTRNCTNDIQLRLNPKL